MFIRLSRIALLVLAWLSASGPARAAGPETVEGDRWMEIDLYWFDRDRIGVSADRFWDRFAPLYQGLDGWRGVILNIGWTSSYVLDWRGRLEDRIPLPEGMQEQNWFRVTGLLTGTTPERQKQWRERFRNPASHLKRDYQPWTYGDVRSLTDALRQSAGRHGLAGVRIGSFVLGCRTIYGGKDFPFSLRHPNVFVRGPVFGSGVFDPRARLAADPTAYGAYPDGIPEGLPITQFFGGQWGSLSRAVGLDALVLRDSMVGPVTYRRVGPFGPAASSDPAADAAWTADTAALVRFTKLANPSALVIGYSTGASAVGEWRVDCIDLEAIAKEGYLDAWIDQSWAWAWNEVGVREDGFWNAPYLGWTYQLASILVHGAQLANTRTRHYVLTETFDAWESWDIIHTASERLRWGIWAYLHAAVKKPGALRVPDGSYISWANQGSRLLSAGDVAFLADETNAALADARSMTQVFGGTLAYNRAALLWRQEHAPQLFMSEWIDEQAAGVLKWGVPILSVARTEDLPNIDADLLIVQTPIQMAPRDQAALLRWPKEGRALAIFASLSAGTDPAVGALAGVSAAHATPSAGQPATGALAAGAAEIGAGIPPTFSLYQPALADRAAPGTRVIYTVNGSPALTVRSVGGAPVVFWDPADLNYEAFPDWLDEPMVRRMGSVYPFVLAARTLGEALTGSGSPHVARAAGADPATLLAWKGNDGRYRLLAADLEEGLSDAARTPYAIDVELPTSWSKGGALSWSAHWRDRRGMAATALRLSLGQAESELYLLR
jgi:hypothetical protein